MQNTWQREFGVVCQGHQVICDQTQIPTQAAKSTHLSATNCQLILKNNFSGAKHRVGTQPTAVIFIVTVTAEAVAIPEATREIRDKDNEIQDVIPECSKSKGFKNTN